MANSKIQIAIDGPASAGKSTVAKLVAKHFNFIYCDTGAMYRVLTLKALKANVDFADEDALMTLLADTQIGFEPGEPVQKVFLDGQEVTNDIRQPEVTNNVSTVAALGRVREELTNRQREIASKGGIVMDGRDIGTTVLPNAEVKIFLIASVDERARRRFADNEAKGIHTPLDVLKQEIETRDYKDSHRKIAPLTQAKDAVKVDTTPMSIEQVVDEIIEIASKKIK
ncbi:cytidylate kinase [Secundilactobacillus oryzae JCM 18671]|uniref:Cytidylate kinase n=1 Tax=Secundilactobacillus oryzae JCM 18671 TaxID=1291743 RepID=A0A081BH99_9LACO|nr:(d)CMP kinase [Secundilactobacillus oryzae]GAK47417.1 cytidylate kinase [Secundilactobacillus oryzae JCM 18671]